MSTASVDRFAFGPAGGETEIFADDFDAYADGSKLEDQTGWIAMGSSTVEIRKPASDGRIFGGSDASIRRNDTYNSDQFATLVLAAVDGTNNRQLGISARNQSGAETYYRALYQDGATATIFLDVVEAGVVTALTSTGQALSNGDSLKIKVSGAGSSTRITVQFDTGSGFTDAITNHDPGTGNYYDNGTPGVAMDGAAFNGYLGNDFAAGNL